MSSASAKEITAPTTAWVLVAAGPKMLARRLIGSPSHSRIPSTGAYRTSQWLYGVRAAHRRAHDWIRAGIRRRWPQSVDGQDAVVTGHATRRLPLPLLPAFVVDALPQQWWAVGNLHFVFRTGKTWHFCVGRDRRGESVRTIELSGRRLAWGRQPFDYERARLDAEQLAARLRAPCCVTGR